MTQYRYEIRGYYFEKEDNMDTKVNFVCYTPPCLNSYTAKLYIMEKLKEYQNCITSIARIIE